MEYKLEISTETKHNVFYFEKTRYVSTIEEIVDYVDEMAKIYKKSAKLIVVVFDVDKKRVAMYNYDSGWLMF